MPAAKTVLGDIPRHPRRSLHVHSIGDMVILPYALAGHATCPAPTPFTTGNDPPTRVAHRATYRRHLVSEMRTTPLPPTWMAVETNPDDNNARDSSTANSTPAGSAAVSVKTASRRLEYVNRVSGERTSHHPGTSYFVAAVENERRRSRWQARGDTGAVSAPSPRGTSSIIIGNNGSGGNTIGNNTGIIRSTDGSLVSPTLGRAQEEEVVVSGASKNSDGQDPGQATPPGPNSTR